MYDGRFHHVLAEFKIAKLAILHLSAKSAFGSQDEVYVRFFFSATGPDGMLCQSEKLSERHRSKVTLSFYEHLS